MLGVPVLGDLDEASAVVRQLRVHTVAVTAGVEMGGSALRRLAWDLEGSGIDHIEGGYRFEPIEDGARTIATYALGIDPGVRVPGLLARRLNSELMKRSVGELADEVERRA